MEALLCAQLRIFRYVGLGCHLYPVEACDRWDRTDANPRKRPPRSWTVGSRPFLHVILRAGAAHPSVAFECLPCPPRYSDVRGGG
eukprot:scaffold24_cov341-Pavlova_lutheri.AAC.74